MQFTKFKNYERISTKYL